MLQRYADFLASAPHGYIALGDICYTSHLRRNHYPYRLGAHRHFSSGTATDLDRAPPRRTGKVVTPLPSAMRPKHRNPDRLSLYRPRIPMRHGTELYSTEPLFPRRNRPLRASVQECLGRSLLALLYARMMRRRRGKMSIGHRTTQLTNQPIRRIVINESATDLADSHPCGQVANFVISAHWPIWRVGASSRMWSWEKQLGAICRRVYRRRPHARRWRAPGGGTGSARMETADGEMVSVLATEMRLHH
ncbi:MAG: hypothetical protein R2867_27765 [Caldilineaceae bacterium]